MYSGICPYFRAIMYCTRNPHDFLFRLNHKKTACPKADRFLEERVFFAGILVKHLFPPGAFRVGIGSLAIMGVFLARLRLLLILLLLRRIRLLLLVLGLRRGGTLRKVSVITLIAAGRRLLHINIVVVAVHGVGEFRRSLLRGSAREGYVAVFDVDGGGDEEKFFFSVDGFEILVGLAVDVAGHLAGFCIYRIVGTVEFGIVGAWRGAVFKTYGEGAHIRQSFASLSRVER